jgi:hypothetical protein
VIISRETTDVSTDTTTVVVFDTVAHTVTTTVDGGTPEVRPMTPAEAAHGDMLTVGTTAQANVAQMTVEQDESVDKLVAVVEALNLITDMTNAEINANPAAIIKDVARELKTVARVANREARITSGRTEDTHTGTDTDV